MERWNPKRWSRPCLRLPPCSLGLRGVVHCRTPLTRLFFSSPPHLRRTTSAEFDAVLSLNPSPLFSLSALRSFKTFFRQIVSSFRIRLPLMDAIAYPIYAFLALKVFLCPPPTARFLFSLSHYFFGQSDPSPSAELALCCFLLTP